jgi:hypothetical protein
MRRFRRERLLRELRGEPEPPPLVPPGALLVGSGAIIGALAVLFALGY